MKKLMWVAIALSLCAMTSQAQDVPKADVSMGYSFLRLSASGASTNLNGVSGSIGVNATSVLGIVADIGYYHGSPGGVGLNAVSYLFGPRFNFRKSEKVVPFFQALFGAAHSSASGVSSNNFAYGFGGGADLGISHSGKVGLRPQFDYIGIRASGTTINSERLSIGIVFHIGEK
jgi:hypothetical protein